MKNKLEKEKLIEEVYHYFNNSGKYGCDEFISFLHKFTKFKVKDRIDILRTGYDYFIEEAELWKIHEQRIMEAFDLRKETDEDKEIIFEKYYRLDKAFREFLYLLARIA